MDLLSVRQKLVASNVANADTPGYRTKDIDFRTEFDSESGLQAKEIEPGGLPVKGDGNNVSLDRESRLLVGERSTVLRRIKPREIRTRAIRSAIDEGKTA